MDLPIFLIVSYVGIILIILLTVVGILRFFKR
ncbi:hypothetical protein HNR27_000648 [Ornithinibacillus bavariensis]